ncbi:unnamed protein product [Protopolystoma xenopodis]|uniref:Uncharacterized protein n=1 Tax=Protopolystoma xenopodis TaxID=117903 RepID=A0A3S5B8P0_9PLAT|nr:unnamed protein product [Protopolystoma xenopodis]
MKGCLNWIGRQQKEELHAVTTTGKRKIREAIDMLWEKNLMNRRLEKGRVSDKFAYCLSKLGENRNRAWINDLPLTGGKGFSAIKRRVFQCVMLVSNKPVQLWGPGSQGAGQTDKQTVAEIRRYGQNVPETHLRCQMRPEIGVHSLLR